MQPTPFVCHCLAELARIHRVIEPTFDARGVARIATANGLTYECRLTAGQNHMSISMRLGSVPESHRADLLLQALRSNLSLSNTCDAVLAYDDETQSLSVQQSWSLDHFDSMGFQHAMRSLKETADRWLGKLLAARQDRSGTHLPKAHLAVATRQAV